jgi:hypothetical protein
MELLPPLAAEGIRRLPDAMAWMQPLPFGLPVKTKTARQNLFWRAVGSLNSGIDVLRQ